MTRGSDDVGASAPGPTAVATSITDASAVSPLGETVAAPAGQPGELAARTIIGRYEILYKLGEGGMGVVYAAHDTELARDVAIKLLRDDRGGNAGLEIRLQREAQAMARLSHENVVAVFDVGIHQRHVYLAMELIDGTTVAVWAKSKRWREVVAVYAAAGRGLAEAHAAGIIHRDFKPSNVMVDERGRVRVTDFGLARAAGGEDRQASDADVLDASVTRDGALLGTPKYMSPEQLDRLPATERSDQFSYAVALCESISGAAPFEGKTTTALLAAIRTGRIAYPAKAPGWLRRILARALAADPAKRFASMAALLAALDRGRRRRTRVAVAAATLGLVGGTAALALALGRSPAGIDCDRAGDRAAAAFTPAQRARISDQLPRLRPATGGATATRVIARLEAYADAVAEARVGACHATVDHGEQWTRVLDLRMECFDQRIRSLETVARALADAPTAELVDHADGALALLAPLAVCQRGDAATLVEPPPPDRKAEVDRVEDALVDASVTKTRGDYAAALAAVAPIVERARASSYPPLLARALDLEGELASLLADKRAEPALREAAEVAASARDDATGARAWLHLLALAGKSPDHRERYDTTLVAARAAVARTADPMLASDLDLVHGQALIAAGKYPEAETSCRRAVEAQERAHGASSLEVRPAVACVGDAISSRADYAAARPWLERAVAIDKTILGSDHPITASDIQILCELELRVGKFDEGTALCTQSLAIRTRVFGAESDEVAHTEKALGDILNDSGKPTDALPHIERAIAIVTMLHGSASLELASALASLGSDYDSLDRHAEAVELFQKSIAIYDKAGATDHPNLGITLINLEDVLISDHRYLEARAAATRAIAIFQNRLGPDDPMLAFPLYALGRCALYTGHAAEAIDPLERAVKLTDPATSDPTNLAGFRFALARALWDAGRDRTRARELARLALPAMQAQAGAEAQVHEVETWLKTH